MASSRISKSELHDHFIGAGALSYPWWVQAEENFPGLEVPEDWEITGIIGGSEDEGDTLRPFRITGALLWVVVVAIGSGRVPGIDYDSNVAVQCRLLETYPDAADFDQGLADIVLQVAVEGTVIYA